MKRIIFLMLIMLFLSGCAEEVVKKETAPIEMVVTIYFRGNVDSTLYKYYLIFSTSSGIKLPNINLADPFIVRPGEDYNVGDIWNYTGSDQDDISYYYEQFFSTWKDVVRYKISQFRITVPTGFYPTSVTQNEHFDNYNDNTPWNVRDKTSGTVLKVELDITALQSGAETAEDNGRIFFNFIAADILDPSSKGGLMYDYLDSEPSIENKAGAQVSEYDVSNDEDKPAGADIIRWTIKIK